MRKPSRRRGQEEILMRRMAVSSIRFSVSTHVMHERGCEPDVEDQPWLEIRGTLEEPLASVSKIEVSVYPKEKIEVGTARPASIGAVIGTRPHVQVVVPFTPATFGWLWSLALSGQLQHGSLSVTKPRYGKALVPNISFSNEKEE